MDAIIKPSISISAVVTRADGTIEDLGVICKDAVLNDVENAVAEDLELLEETKNEEESE